MIKFLSKSIQYSFYTLLFFVPLVLYPKTSEIFEFNKMVFVYLASIIITTLWTIKSIFLGKLVFKRTLLDIPLLAFLLMMSISTIFSIDQRTSLLGYYSRFNGGLISLISYSLLYWAFVSNFNKRSTVVALIVLFSTTFITSVWAIFEHFGHSFSCLLFGDFRVFDNSCWLQDVQNRVYSSFGQPNWLAGWLVAIIPLTWTFSIIKKPNNLFKNTIFPPQLIFHFMSIIFFVTLLFTKSRSGILAFCISYLVYWLLVFLFTKISKKTLAFVFTLSTSYYLLVTFFIGTPWSPSINETLNNKSSIPQETKTLNIPALEMGGTESGEIRKIVWMGTLDIWKSYPLFGTGLETFAYSYYNFRPAEHNLTSEWDYLYNKAHNEYLNYMATTGTAGTIAYLLLVVYALILIWKTPHNLNVKKQGVDDFKVVSFSLLSGLLAIYVTNFFGFSTVSINVLSFLIPAFAFSMSSRSIDVKHSNLDIFNLNILQKSLLVIVIFIVYYLISATFKYWYADYKYAQSIRLNDSGEYQEAATTLSSIVANNPGEPNYWDELARSTSSLAIFSAENSEEELAVKFAEDSYLHTKKALELSPSNVSLKRKAASRLITLTAIDGNYLLIAKNILERAVMLAPTDAKLHYNLALAYLRSNDFDKSIETIQKTIQLKPDYELARYALALMYIDMGEIQKAIEEFNYILEHINPENVNVRRELNELQP